MNNTNLEQVFQKLWGDYTSQNPSAYKIHALFSDQGERVVNDHIAFRTFNDKRMNIEVLSRPFLERGYRAAGQYLFEGKHLSAMHFEHSDHVDAPRVFISELLLENFSPWLQEQVHKAIDKVSPDIWNSNELIFYGNVFGVPSYKVYERLRVESEYAAWLYVHGFRANHFTVSVNSLNGFRGIAEVNKFVKDNGFLMNTSGGEVKGSAEQLLCQSSTKAEIVPLEFTEGTRDIPACYYEFAERFIDSGGNLFGGFIAGSADKIFESTDFYQK
jgi:hypothetical protein